MVEIGFVFDALAVVGLEVVQGLGLAGAAVGGVAPVGEDVIDGLALAAGVEGLVLGVAALAEVGIGLLRGEAVAVADELEDGV